MNEVVICSIAPFERHWERTYGNYRITPGSPEKPSYVIIADAQDKICTDFESSPRHYVYVDVKAKDIANDLVGAEEQKEGFFVIKEVEPTKEELAAAIETQRKNYAVLVQQGDTSWAQHGKHEHISDAQRRAAHALGMERPWAITVKPKMSCPACGELVPSHVALCKYCQAVINKEAYDKLEFATKGAQRGSFDRMSDGKHA
jgi:hypothetical protein